MAGPEGSPAPGRPWRRAGGRVAQRQAHRVLGGDAAQALARVRRHGIASPRGLEPDDAAARRGGPDRSEPVAGVRDRQHARAHRGGRAPARSAGDPRQIPGILRRAIELRLAGERQPDLAGIGAAEDDEAGALEPHDVLAVHGGRRRVGEEARAARHLHTRERCREVLQEEGHAPERPLGQAVGDGLAPVVIQAHHHRVHRGVACLHALDGRLEQVAGRDLAPPHEIGQTGAS